MKKLLTLLFLLITGITYAGGLQLDYETAVDNYFQNLSKELPKKANEALHKEMTELAKNARLQLQKEFGTGYAFKCCCIICTTCWCVVPATQAILTAIELAKYQVLLALQLAETQLAYTVMATGMLHGKLLSGEAFLIRKDIVNAIKEEGDKQIAVWNQIGKLLAQNNYLRSLNAELKLAILRALYGKLDLKNLKQFQEVLQKIRGQY